MEERKHIVAGDCRCVDTMLRALYWCHMPKDVEVKWPFVNRCLLYADEVKEVCELTEKDKGRLETVMRYAKEHEVTLPVADNILVVSSNALPPCRAKESLLLGEKVLK